jgi:hypothetical protein
LWNITVSLSVLSERSTFSRCSDSGVHMAHDRKGPQRVQDRRRR